LHTSAVEYYSTYCNIDGSILYSEVYSHRKDRKSMVEEELHHRLDGVRGRYIPLEDLIVRREKEIVAEQYLTSYLCLCTKCYGGQRKTLKTIDVHREKYRRDQHLLFLVLGGDSLGGYPQGGIWLNEDRDLNDDKNVFDDAETGSIYGEEMDAYYDVQQEVRDTL
jgi:hypothetical protein